VPLLTPQLRRTMVTPLLLSGVNDLIELKAVDIGVALRPQRKMVGKLEGKIHS
jgi:hypothetical protein